MVLVSRTLGAEDLEVKRERSATPAVPTPHHYSPFGTPGETPPEMLAALDRMSEACVVEGRRGSLGHFRWSGTPSKLSHLGLWGVKVGDELMPLTSVMPDLQYVSLYETNVDDEGVQALLKLPHLRSLAVTAINRYEKAGCPIPQWSYPFMKPRADRLHVTGKSVQTLAAVPNLEGLDLLDAKLTSADLKPLASYPKLSSISLPMVIDAEAVQNLQACKRLTSLTLGYREVSAAELMNLSQWKSLRKLTLMHATLSDEALEALAKVESLQELGLMECGLTDDRLSHLQGPPKLTILLLNRNEIRGPGLAHVAKLKLKTLDLGHNNLSDDTLTQLPQLDTLENLGLEYCRQITDRGIRTGILQSMTHLQDLRLRGLPEVTDASLDDLMKFGHLRQITIREDKISAVAVERMRQAMPHTIVFK